MTLPFDPTQPLTPELKKNPHLWKDFARELCERHHIAFSDFTSFSAGGSLVAAVNETTVLKLIQPPFLRDWEAEQWALKRFPSDHPELPVKIPRLIKAQKLADGWSYLFMTRVPGVQLDAVWPTLTHKNRCRIMGQIGRLMKFVHQHARLKQSDRGWSEFIEQQARHCLARQQETHAPAWLMADLADTLSRRGQEDDEGLVLLTGEYTPLNLLVEQSSQSWELTGMIDFADAFAGKAHYDLIGPGVFLAAGDAELIDALFTGYGLSAAERTPELRQRLMTLHLLHRFSHLPRQIALKGWESKAGSIEELSRLLWPFEASNE